MHLDDDLVQRVVDGELAAAAEPAVRVHLAQCAACQARVSGAEAEEREVNDLLATLDVTRPAASAASIVRRASVQRSMLAWRRAAAALLIAGSAAVAWAAPGSPLPRLVRQWLGTGTPARQPDPIAAAPAPSAPAGISVLPGRALRIEFAETYRGAVAELSLSDSAEVQVRVTRGSATFTSGQDRLRIAGSTDSARFEIAVPRAAPLVEVVVGSQRVFLKQGDRVRTDAPVRPGGGHLISLSPR